jgi:hypothetical protein
VCVCVCVHVCVCACVCVCVWWWWWGSFTICLSSSYVWAVVLKHRALLADIQLTTMPTGLHTRRWCAVVLNTILDSIAGHVAALAAASRATGVMAEGYSRCLDDHATTAELLVSFSRVVRNAPECAGADSVHRRCAALQAVAPPSSPLLWASLTAVSPLCR